MWFKWGTAEKDKEEYYDQVASDVESVNGREFERMDSELSEQDASLMEKIDSETEEPAETEFPHERKVAFGMGRKAMAVLMLYSTLTASLLIVNKVAMYYLHMPAIILFFQLFCTAAATFIAGKRRHIEVDELTKTKVKEFWMVPAAYALTMFSTLKLLELCNVETVMVLGASTKLVLALLDTAVLNRAIPTKRSAVFLLGIFTGCLSYMYFEHSEFTELSVMWGTVWFVVICVDQIFIKQVVENVTITAWGRVYYTNLVPLVPLLLLHLISGESIVDVEVEVSKGVMWLCVSCIIVPVLTFLAFTAKEKAPGNSFPFIGEACKVGTVMINFFIWDMHASILGIASLFACLACAFMYERGPVHSENSKKEITKSRLKWFLQRAAPAGFAVFVLLPWIAGVQVILPRDSITIFHYSSATFPSWLKNAITEDAPFFKEALTLSRVQRVRLHDDNEPLRPITHLSVHPVADVKGPNAGSFFALSRHVDVKSFESNRAKGEHRGWTIQKRTLNRSWNEVKGDEPVTLLNGTNVMPFILNGENWALIQDPQEYPVQKQSMDNYLMNLDGKGYVKLNGEAISAGKWAWCPIAHNGNLLFVQKLFPLVIDQVTNFEAGVVTNIYRQTDEVRSPSGYGRFIPTTQGLVMDGRWVWGLGYVVYDTKPGKSAQEPIFWKIDLFNPSHGVIVRKVGVPKIPNSFVPLSLFVDEDSILVSGIESDKVFSTSEKLRLRRPSSRFRFHVYKVGPSTSP